MWGQKNGAPAPRNPTHLPPAAAASATQLEPQATSLAALGRFCHVANMPGDAYSTAGSHLTNDTDLSALPCLPGYRSNNSSTIARTQAFK